MLTSFIIGKASLLTSLFFIMGVFIVFQVSFEGLKKLLTLKDFNFDGFTLRAILGIIYIVVVLFILQSSVQGRAPSWTFINFQLVAVIFYTVILNVPFKFHLFAPIVLAFMIFNSAIRSWESWCLAFILIAFFYTLNYIKVRINKKFPYFYYLFSSLFFGVAYWFFAKLKFNITNQMFGKEIFYLLILEIFTFGYIAMLFTDVESRTALFRDATHDKLTSTYNYDAFDIDLRDLFKKVKQSDMKFTMLMFDIDHFKNINDTYGHLAGDEVLRSVVEVVQTVIDQTDPKIKLYRTGGEEFNIIFPNYELNQTENIVGQIFSAINHSETTFEDKTIHLTVSMGVSEVRKDDVSMNDFYSRVDEALYHSKRNGRHVITID
ncbi:GGDEF domain-containing protein [Companilactobacillus huachuanensis]|uniref:GGDEF domain-containing protein n=1 Tax=Companilactobacillus huachuanensis TaxID=2559914 RepID=A0ABW1RI61_9LACO|nr:GGDEF domain-containing protein [Companilactobacillus huachuanensis]